MGAFKRLKKLLMKMGVLKGRPLLLLANKQDLAGAASPGYLAALLGVSSGSCRGREFSVQGCSAIKGEGVE
ncbi:uncharacterized protein HaLaN_31552, partial [Haematococcus lacustris]